MEAVCFIVGMLIILVVIFRSTGPPKDYRDDG